MTKPKVKAKFKPGDEKPEYSLKPARPVIREIPYDASMQLLEALLLQETTDFTIISLDFKYDSRQKDGHQILEVGISTLSANELRKFPTSSTIHSRRLITPKAYTGRKSRPPFLFGESEPMFKRDLPKVLKDVISTGKVVLVGHDISKELYMLEKIGIDLRDQKLFSIEGILSLHTIMAPTKVFPSKPSLKSILVHLGIPVQKWGPHNAGNDAHMTLRALLMLTAKHFETGDPGETAKARISKLEWIARRPINYDSPLPDQKKHEDKHRAQIVAKKAEGIRFGQRRAIISSVGEWRSSNEEHIGFGTIGWTDDESDCSESHTSNLESPARNPIISGLRTPSTESYGAEEVANKLEGLKWKQILVVRPRNDVSDSSEAPSAVAFTDDGSNDSEAEARRSELCNDKFTRASDSSAEEFSESLGLS